MKKKPIFQVGNRGIIQQVYIYIAGRPRREGSETS